MNKKQITIDDIAQIIGVSKATVSYAFNKKARISEEMRSRIMDVADELGYIPNPVARILTTKRIGAIGLLLPQNIQFSFNNPFYLKLIQGIGSICINQGMTVSIISPIYGDINNSVRNCIVDGFITLGLEPHMKTYRILKYRRIPFVSIDVKTIENVPSVTSNDKKGAHELMKYVLEMGHKSIAIISFILARQYKEEHESILRNLRMQGYFSALKEIGLSEKSDSINTYQCECTLEGGMKVAEDIFSKKNKPTAIIAMSDIIAMGVMSYCKKNKIKVPRDISICGFDNVPLSDLTHPALTTVDQRIYEKASTAATMLMNLINNNELLEYHIQYKTILEIRDSVRNIS